MGLLVTHDHTFSFFMSRLNYGMSPFKVTTSLYFNVNVSGISCESDCRSRGPEFDPARYHTFMEIDYEIIFRVVHLPSAESFKKDCCLLQAKVCARSTGKLLVQACPGKKCD